MVGPPLGGLFYLEGGKYMKESHEFTCMKCNNVIIIKANPEDMQEWKNGAHIQNAMPYLTADERELMISKICGPCFDKMFGY